MPLPMVHLAIAVEMHALRGTAPTPLFLLGSIAPDAIHMRPDAGEDSKQRVHLQAPPDSVDHERVRALVVQHRVEGADLAGFAEGYAAHLLADRLWWRELVVGLFLERIPPGLSIQQQRALYYQDTDQVDFNLYHQAPWREEVWAKLAAARPVDFASLLTAEEIGCWRDRTLNWFGGLKEEPGIEPVYITDADAQAFIAEAVKMVAGYFAAWEKSD